MPRTELPSGNWIEWSPTWMSGVRFKVMSAVVYRSTVVNGEMVQETDAANVDRQRIALWGEQITGWSWADKGIPVPAHNVAGAEVIWSVLDGPDYNALADATQELFEQVTAIPTRPKNARPSSAA